MDSISVSDSSEPDWDLAAPDSDDADWISSTIHTKLYPIFLSPEDQDTDDDEDEAAEEENLEAMVPAGGGDETDNNLEWQGCAPTQKRKQMKSESSKWGKSKCFK